jgi:uncharacterized tellurite resistance protein B-like protein
MLNRIKTLLASGPSAEPEAEHERIQVATCVLLLEMAHTDGEFHSMEGTLIQDLLQHKFDLSEKATDELMEYARQEREASLDLYQFAKQINENFTLDEKLEMMDVLWRIIYADGVLDKYEDYLVRQLATLLRLSHRQMIDAKVKVLDEIRPDR